MARLLESAEQALAWMAQRRVTALTTDSRQVRQGDAFIAWPGATHDARRFVGDALRAGASACLVEADGADAFAFHADDERVAMMRGLKKATGHLASGFLGHPSERLKVVAVTGTNGKTSTSWWVAQALTALGVRGAVIGTLGAGVPPSVHDQGTLRATGLTTPDPVALHAAFKGFADSGFGACAIEASSIGIVEHRLAGTRIQAALFTNFTQDHLDYHGSMDAYWQAKAQLFVWPGLRHAVINVDDPRGAELAQTLHGSAAEVWTYSTQQQARLRASNVRYIEGALVFDLHEGDAQVEMRTALIGDYNVSNLLAVAGGLRALGVTLRDVAAACGHCTPVPGRMQRVEHAQFAGAALPQVVVDYAHTPDALEKTLLALQPLAQARGGQLWCVFGCGGNRDAGKRPLMGAIAQKLAAHVVVTSDNPRDERAHDILNQIVAGMTDGGTPIVIQDRRSALDQAIRLAGAHDVILVAGKGHEDYQEIAGVRHPFSDVVEAHTLLGRRAREARP